MQTTSLGALAKRHRLSLSLIGIATACAVILPACGGGGDAGPAAGPATMAIVVTSTPATGSVQDGSTRQFSIEVRDQSNAVLSSYTTALWSITGTPGIATVGASGLATCISIGSVTVHAVGPAAASGANLAADASLDCIAPPSVPTSMTIVVTSSPATGTVMVGATRQYTVQVRDQFSAVLSAFTTASWSILGTPGVATISVQGLATCLGVGNVSVQAIGPANGSGTNLAADLALQCIAPPPVVVSVVVTPPSANCLPGTTVQFTAKGVDGTGAEVAGSVSGWSSDNTGVATVSATGLASCGTVGATKVRATAGSGAAAPSGSADQNVRASSTIASIHVLPSHTFLTPSAVGSPTVQLTATAFNAGGAQISPVNFVWATSNASVAPVSVSGLVTGNVNGGALITASSGGRSGTAAISMGTVGAIQAPLV